MTVLDNLSPQVHGQEPVESATAEALGEGVELVIGDVRDPEAWARAYDDHEVVVHLAAETGTGQSMYEVSRYCDVNVVGTARLMDFLTNSEHAVRRVVVASSRSIYGEGRYVDDEGVAHYPSARGRDALLSGLFEPTTADGRPLRATATDEGSRIHPSSVYGITKSTQEQLVLKGCSALGIPATGLRYQNVFGPGQSLANPYTGILSIFTSLIQQGRQINVFEDGLESRDFVFVDDVVRATVAAVDSDRAGESCYNVGTGSPVTVLQVVQTLADVLGVTVDSRVSGDFRAGDIRHNWADTTLVREELAFETEVDFRTGVGLFCAWATHEVPSSADSYERSLQELRARKLMG